MWAVVILPITAKVGEKVGDVSRSLLIVPAKSATRPVCGADETDKFY